MTGKIRTLIIDDKPRFAEPKKQEMIPFDEPFQPADRNIYERNFSAQWVYDGRQMMELYHRLHMSLIAEPKELLEAHQYPNMLWIDYKIENTDLEKFFYNYPDARRFYDETLNPLTGDWGKHHELFGLSEGDFLAKVEKNAKSADVGFAGFTVGMEITKLLREYACYPVPQTAQTDPPETRFQESLLDLEYGEAFAKKSGALSSWHEFFSKGLPWFREQLVRTARKGTLTPRLADLIAPSEDAEFDREREVHFRSALGVESFRVEALFFDKFYSYPETKPGLVANDPAIAAAEYSAWSAKLIKAAIGSHGHDEVSQALRLADRFRWAYRRPLHTWRRHLSRELVEAYKIDRDKALAIYCDHEADIAAIEISRDEFVRRVLADEMADIVLPDAVSNAISDVGEIETALQEPRNMALLAAFGIAPEIVRERFANGTIQSLEISAEQHVKFGITGPIVTAAEGNDLVARYAILALLVYAEWLWFALEQSQLDRIHDDIKAMLENEPMVEVEDVLERLAREATGILPNDWLSAFETGDFNDKLLHEADDRVDAVLAARELVDDEEHGRSGAKVGSGMTLKAELMIDLLSPAPVPLLMWRDRGKDMHRNEVTRPLERLQPKLAVKSVISGPPGTPGGLLPGEGRLIRVFAVHWGFDIDFWPPWMRVGVKV